MAIKRRSSAPTITDVLRQHIDTSGDCHVWLMGHNGHGRPVTYIRGKAEYVYRVLYEEIYGAITLNLCHRCDNPGCVNLEHVFEGTLADNNRDSALKGRKRGERHSRTSFTDDDIRAIRSDIRSHQAIAEDYGVHRTTISHIKRGKNWSHVQ